MPQAVPPTGAPAARLRIVVADAPEVCKSYAEWLPSQGHELAGVAHTGRELVERCRQLRPDLVITEAELPGLDGLAASVEINRDLAHQVPVVLVTTRQNGQILDRFATDHVMAFLNKPVKPADLAVAIRLAAVRFAQYQELCGQVRDLGQALGDRKLIDRAKQVLMRQAGVDEEQTFQRLRQLANDKNQTPVEAARLVLIADEAFRPAGHERR
jgi:response regulator NasT